jgi:hypothetical protein
MPAIIIWAMLHEKLSLAFRDSESQCQSSQLFRIFRSCSLNLERLKAKDWIVSRNAIPNYRYRPVSIDSMLCLFINIGIAPRNFGSITFFGVQVAMKSTRRVRVSRPATKPTLRVIACAITESLEILREIDLFENHQNSRKYFLKRQRWGSAFLVRD